MKIVIVGPAHPLRGGGLASFNERLSRQFMQEGHEVIIYTFSLQYPGFLFPGTTQYSTEPAPEDLNIKVCINSVNPFNWFRIGTELRKLRPDVVVVRYWLPFMGACLGTILRRVRKNRRSKIVCIADNIIPHEHRVGDKQLTRYFIKPVDTFITMSEKVLHDLRRFTDKPAALVTHPLYDHFGEALPKETARKHLAISDDPLILFFGFIRKYKGLDILLRAMKILIEKHKRENTILPRLLIAGEFYGDRSLYDQLIKELGLETVLILHTHFIADSEVRYYLSACDFVVQPYRDATQSGVTPLAYHFEKPMLVTNVGGLPDMVPDEKAGIVVEPTPEAIAAGIEKLYQKGESYFLPFLQQEKKKYSWDLLTQRILTMAKPE